MRFYLLLAVILTSISYSTQKIYNDENILEQSFFKLTTSNGLIVAVYDTKKSLIEYVFPHIFSNYDSAKFVQPFVGNIKLNTSELPSATKYLNNTHIIQAQYKNYNVNYFSSFTNDDKVFYVVIRGKEPDLDKLSFNYESGNGKLLTSIQLLTNSHQDLSVHLAGKLYATSYLRKYNKDIYEKYFLFTFTDSLHTDASLIGEALSKLKNENKSLLDVEVNFMKNLFSKCKIPKTISDKEKNVVEQSITILKMSQVSDSEIFPNSRGQILASLRPGLWHVSWVRDGSYAIQAMTHLGMFEEAKSGLEFMLNAKSGYYKHYIHKDGKDYGVGSDYQISVCRYYGNGKEESTYVDGPNIEFDNFGLFLTAYSDYVLNSMDTAFYKKWNELVTTKVADVTISCIDANSLIREDSGPWEHYLQMPKQYTFTSGVCALGLEQFALLQKQFNAPYDKYESAAVLLRNGILNNMLCDKRYLKGNFNDKLESDHEFYDAGVFELFANTLITDKELFASHMEEYDKRLRIKGERPGYIRLSSADPYENQEWVFINLRIALAHILFGEKSKADELLNYITEQASLNNNIIPEMLSNKVQSDKVTDYYLSHDIWCNCIRDKDDLYIGAIPMVGYGSGAYILALLAYYNK
jgi:hypothetical protein